MGRIKPAALLLQSKRKKGPARFSIRSIYACNVVIILLLSVVFIYNNKKKQDNVRETSLVINPGGEGGSSSQYAVLNTTKGLITLQLYAEKVPKTVKNFVTRSQNGYYNGAAFHRVIKGFMIQWGHPQDDGTGGQSTLIETSNDEFISGLKHDPFSLSMAHTGPGSNGSQFFINTVGRPNLDNEHIVFGRVVIGQEVVQEIENSPTDSDNRPLERVLIHTIQIKDSP